MAVAESQSAEAVLPGLPPDQGGFGFIYNGLP
jgi:hypothetical protein